VPGLPSSVAARAHCAYPDAHRLHNISSLPTEITQELENVRVTRSRKGDMDLGDAHATMAHLAMCNKFEDFSFFYDGY